MGGNNFRKSITRLEQGLSHYGVMKCWGGMPDAARGSLQKDWNQGDARVLIAEAFGRIEALVATRLPGPLPI